MSVLDEIARERQRLTVDPQVCLQGELCRAALCYIEPRELTEDYWPWTDYDSNFQDLRANLVKAAAFLVAEIERLDRISTANHT